MTRAAPDATGVVLTASGARAAYEAGALSVLLPALAARGARPRIYAGAGGGALNAGLLAASQHLDPEQQGERLVAFWRDLRRGDVLGSLARVAPAAGAGYAGQLLGVPGTRVSGLLDAGPLRRNLDGWIDFERLRANVREGHVAAVAAITASSRSGGTVTFYASHEPRRLHRSHAVAYVETELEPAHVAAAAALPVLWPPVRVARPERVAGWYVDGTTRLRSPLKPALDLGAERLVAVAAESIEGPTLTPDEPADRDDPPDVGDGLLHLLEGALTDPLLEDVRTLGTVNAFFADGAMLGAKLYRSVRGKTPYRAVPYVFVGPQRRGALGDLAAEVRREKGGVLRVLRDPGFAIFEGLAGRFAARHDTLLGIAFFEPAYIRRLLETGRADAEAWLAGEHDGEDGLWQLGPLTAVVRPRQWTAG